jgi:hypothetical protein
MPKFTAEQTAAIQDEIKHILSKDEYWASHREKILEAVKDNDRDWIWSQVKNLLPWLLGGGVLASIAVSTNIVWGWIYVKPSEELLREAKSQIQQVLDKDLDDYLGDLKVRADSDHKKYELTLASLAERMTDIHDRMSKITDDEGEDFRKELAEYREQVTRDIAGIQASRGTIEQETRQLIELLAEKTIEVQQIDKIYRKSELINNLTAYKVNVTEELAEYVRTAPEFERTLWQYAVPDDVIIAVDSAVDCPSLFQEVGIVDPQWGDEINALKKLTELGRENEKSNDDTRFNPPTRADDDEKIYTRFAVKLCRKKKSRT